MEEFSLAMPAEAPRGTEPNIRLELNLSTIVKHGVYRFPSSAASPLDRLICDLFVARCVVIFILKT